MIARITSFAILVLLLASYASSPATSGTVHPNMAVACCDGDPSGPPGH
jgi:hypothetical protein